MYETNKKDNIFKFYLINFLQLINSLSLNSQIRLLKTKV